MPQDVPDCRRGNVCIFLRCRDYDSLDFGSEAAVGIGYGSFVLEVQHIADSPHNVPDAHFPANVNGKPVILDDLHAFETLRRLADYLQLLLHIEETGLVLIDAGRDDNGIKHSEGPFEYIEVPCGEGVE